MSTEHTSPHIGLVGSEGAYGRWLRRFFEQRMGLQVLGADPGHVDTQTPEALIEHCQVLLFCTPIRHTPAIITDYIERAAGREKHQLWLDITSVKNEPVAAMLHSQAEVVGLHPMTAAPKAPTLKGRVLVVCEARLQYWRAWFETFLAALQAQCVASTPERHDHIMALVQAMVHATHLAQGGVLREYAEELGGLDALLPFRSASFELDSAILSRILAMNPAIYEDIQFGNPHVIPMLERLQTQLAELKTSVERNDDTGRAAFRRQFLDAARETLGETAVAAGNYSFERVGYLLADLAGERSISVHLPEDQPGSLRRLLHVFERHNVNITSIHSSRTPAGEVHFRLGFESDVDAGRIAPALAAIVDEDIGRLLERSTDLC
ncbi:prephenate dehydrogenase [Xanthomonadaceae bacterium JHOS43]|nr:prephenate dehydrogenase [Xanthomonadaceae bacterium JHOS43]MCX7563970.1 prephenate dehydrogenase [Xanthomonadaceae bacterium XH05]